MNRLKKLSLLVITLTIWAVTDVRAQWVEDTSTSSSTCFLGSQTAWLDINNVRMRVGNNGSLFGLGADLYRVPETTTAINNIGIWVGGKVNGEVRFAGRSTLLAAFSLWPGPLDDEGNPPEECQTYDAIHVVSSDGNISSKVRAKPEEIARWSERLDFSGSKLQEILGSERAAKNNGEALAFQLASWVHNDVGNKEDWTTRKPIGLEITAMVYAFKGMSVLENTTFVRYKFTNKGPFTLQDAYVGLWVAPALGNVTDNFVGSDTTLSMAYVYNSDNFDEGLNGYGLNPPALGVTLLESPSARSDLKDNDRDGEIDEPSERLGLTSFIAYGDDFTPRDRENDLQERYHYLQGRWRNGDPITIGGKGYGGTEQTKFMYSGDPVTGAYWSEENIDGQGERSALGLHHFILSTGPFTLAPGQEESVEYAIVWSRGKDRLDSITRLRQEVEIVRARYEIQQYKTAESLYLRQNYPNPFSEKTRVTYLVEDHAEVKVTIHDLLGRQVATLVNGLHEPGVYWKDWDASHLASGVYLSRIVIKTGGKIKQGLRKMVLVR